MLTKILALLAVGFALVTIYSAYTQPSALYLRQEGQLLYWPRYGTNLSGYYRNRIWQPSPNRIEYTQFPGGGPSAAK